MITRFAPSPTGRLHLGHAFAALFAWREAQAVGGTFLVRLEDIDTTRCREEFVAPIFEDLRWLGLAWPEPVWRQSGRMPAYQEALATLENLGLLYPCFCTRQEIASAVSAPQGPEGPLYPGACRNLPPDERSRRMASGQHCAWRLDVAKAMALTGPLSWHDEIHGDFTATPQVLGDVVLARKDIRTSYHLAVTVDDAAQGVTLVTRGEDLLPSTHLHRLLQELLRLPVPVWKHHRLICDDQGRRLAKRDEARSLQNLREAGLSSEGIKKMLEK